MTPEQELVELRAQVARLRRVLAVEWGQEAPEGWTYYADAASWHHVTSMTWVQRTSRGWLWWRYAADENSIEDRGRAATALEAIEAALPAVAPVDAHSLLTDEVLAELREPEWSQALAAADRGKDPRPIARAGLERRFRSYEGGDRPMSPPAALLRALLAVNRAMSADSSSTTCGRSHEAASAPVEAASAAKGESNE